MRTYNQVKEGNILIVRPDLQEGEVMLSLGCGSSSTCPYDQYARLSADRYRRWLNRAGAPFEIIICNQRLINYTGSGRGGAKRLGDDMIPPEIVVVAQARFITALRFAYEEMSLREGASKPYQIAGELWWDGIKWTRGGAWSKVPHNAIAIARVMIHFHSVDENEAMAEKYQNKIRAIEDRINKLTNKS